MHNSEWLRLVAVAFYLLKNMLNNKKKLSPVQRAWGLEKARSWFRWQQVPQKQFSESIAVLEALEQKNYAVVQEWFSRPCGI